jgi:hypothetical protein
LTPVYPHRRKARELGSFKLIFGLKRPENAAFQAKKKRNPQSLMTDQSTSKNNKLFIPCELAADNHS